MFLSDRAGILAFGLGAEPLPAPSRQASSLSRRARLPTIDTAEAEAGQQRVESSTQQYLDTAGGHRR